MKRFLLLMGSMSVVLFLCSCIANKTTVYDKIPQNLSLSYGQVVYTENDGRCDDGLIIKITGGKKSERIKRKYECVSRPE